MNVNLDDLTPDEDMVLVGLVREVVQADGEFSAAEKRETAAVRTAMGDSRFAAAAERIRQDCPTRAALKEAAKMMSRQEARETIFAVLQQIAYVDGVDEAEEKPLRWLASWWHMDV